MPSASMVSELREPIAPAGRAQPAEHVLPMHSDRGRSWRLRPGPTNSATHSSAAAASISESRAPHRAGPVGIEPLHLATALDLLGDGALTRSNPALRCGSGSTIDSRAGPTKQGITPG